MHKSIIDRLFERVGLHGDCWEWTAGKSDGYGTIWDPAQRRTRKAYAVMYELLMGPVPSGMELDHLCRNRACVRPDHLEPVPKRTNILRGMGVAARHARQTACIHGHPFDADNTISRPGGWRGCRECHRTQSRSASAPTATASVR